MEIIPVIQANMGGRDYYIGKMTFRELAEKVQFYSDLKESQGLESMLQRELKKRSADMTDYLLKQSERFYGSIIVASWGGNPSYKLIQMDDHPLLDGTDFKYGVLVFDGKQEYFALDGQHRLKSIKEAILEDPSLKNEEISVIILPHEQTEEGNIKTRRLFHTLNRYAKPTTTGENISLDEDNVISITTRMLVRNIPLLSPDLLELQKPSITKAQDDKFTTLASVYDFNKSIFDALYDVKKDYLSFRPSAIDVENVYTVFQTAWNHMIDNFEELDKINSGLSSPGDFRKMSENVEQGHILLRPIGIQIYGKLVAQAISSQLSEKKSPTDLLEVSKIEDAINNVGKLPPFLKDLPWNGTIYRNNKIERGGTNMAIKLAAYMLGSDSIDEDELLGEYKGHLDKDDAILPDKVV